MKHALVVFLVFALLGLAAAASAQTVINPTGYEFTPSPDHAAVIDGQPVVARYELRYLQVGGVAVGAVDLGKPTPANGLITGALNLSMLPFSPSTRYIAYVAAIGPTGEGVSQASNPFAKLAAPAAPGAPVIKK